MINIQKNHEKPYVQIMSCNYTKDDDASKFRPIGRCWNDIVFMLFMGRKNDKEIVLNDECLVTHASTLSNLKRALLNTYGKKYLIIPL